MGKTYRKAPNYFLEGEFDEDYKKNKVRKIDKKHQKILVSDGTFGSDTSHSFHSNGKKTLRREWRGDGDFNPKEKRINKRLKSKFDRRHGEIPENDD